MAQPDPELEFQSNSRHPDSSTWSDRGCRDTRSSRPHNFRPDRGRNPHWCSNCRESTDCHSRPRLNHIRWSHRNSCRSEYLTSRRSRCSRCLRRNRWLDRNTLSRQEPCRFRKHRRHTSGTGRSSRSCKRPGQSRSNLRCQRTGIRTDSNCHSRLSK